MNKALGALAWVRTALALSTLWLAGACGAAPVPAGSMVAGHVYFEYAVYYPGPTSGDLARRFAELLRTEGSPRWVRTPPKSPPSEPIVVFHVEEDVTKYPPPDQEFLRYFARGLSSQQAAQLQKSSRVAIIDFAHPSSTSLRALRKADSLVETFARQTNGLIWDEETREIFTPDAWRERRIEAWDGELPDSAKHFTIHAYRNTGLVRAITLGMAKFGLPDLVIEEISWSDSRPMGNLLNAVAQALTEGVAPKREGVLRLDLKELRNERLRNEQVRSVLPNGTGKVDLKVDYVRPKEGDPRNRLVEIGFDAYPGKDLHAKQTKLLAELFGVQPDSVQRVRHDEELERASHAARERLPELRAAFAKGMPPGEFIRLKVPFGTRSGGNEYMWVEVSAWNGGRITGLLKNQPVDVPELQAGQTVEVRESDVFDYYIRRADGTTEGNQTSKIIEKQRGALR